MVYQLEVYDKETNESRDSITMNDLEEAQVWKEDLELLYEKIGKENQFGLRIKDEKGEEITLENS